MTVVATLITQVCTVHASDSLISTVLPTGAVQGEEFEESKLIPVRQFRGAMGYYGLARLDGSWRTATWLRARAARAPEYSSAQEFAESLAHDLQGELARLRNPIEVGLGIHFSAYERVGDYWIPELFHICNWLPGYRGVSPDGMHCSRETWGTVTGKGSSLAHGEPQHRHEVREFLQAGHWLRYNNGDPVIFNTVAGALQEAVEHLDDRGQLRQLGIPEYVALMRESVELVSVLHRDLGRPDARRVGGRIHDIAITPEGAITSTSGDSA